MNKTISSNLKKLRLERKLSQSALCKELSKQGLVLRINTYTKYENANRTIPYKVLYNLAVYYNVSIDSIFGLK